MSEQYDLIVIGAGPGGYVAAIKAAQLGMKTACVDKRKSLGGTCLNIGCIPSKALLQSSHKFEEAQHDLKEHGVEVSDVKLNLEKLMQRKTKVVDDLTGGIDFLFKKNKVTKITGKATLKKGGIVQVDGTDYQAKHILIATGSDVVTLPGIKIDEKVIVSSTGALSLEKVPEKLIVIGGGYIGLELGSVWQRLGSDVTVIEYADRITPGMDKDISAGLMKSMKKQGIKFKLNTKVESVTVEKDSAVVSVSSAKSGDSEQITADIVLLSVGRKPFTEGLNLEDVGIKLDDRGRIDVDQHFNTSVSGIYAIGDVIKGPMLAHKAEEEGVVLVERLAGHDVSINYDAIPGVVYTAPEAASIGKTEQELKEAGVDFKVGKFPFQANSRARANGQTEGFVKLLADAKTDRLLGAHILGNDAGTMIAELAIAMEFGASSEDIARTCHAHPTLNEAVKEAALAVEGLPIHV